MATLPTLTQYPPEKIPNRDTMSAPEFADAVHPYLNFWNETTIPELNVWTTNLELIRQEINDKYIAVKNQAVDGGYSQSYLNSFLVSSKTIVVTTSQELRDAIASVNRKDVNGTVTIELADGVYELDNYIGIRNIGKWDQWLKIRGSNKANVTIKNIGDSYVFTIYDARVWLENITFEGNGSNLFLLASAESHIFLTSGAVDIVNFGKGIVANNKAKVQAQYCNFTNVLKPVEAYTYAEVDVYSSTMMTIQDDTVTSTGVFANTGAYVQCGQSRIENFHNGITCDRNSYVNADRATIYNTYSRGILCQSNSIVSFYSGVFDGNNRNRYDGIYCAGASHVIAGFASVKNSISNCFYCTTNSSISANDSTAENAIALYQAVDKSVIRAERSTAIATTDSQVCYKTTNNSVILAFDSNSTQPSSDGRSVFEAYGGRIVADNAISSPKKTVYIARGGMVTAYGTDFTANITENTATVSGVFYK